MSSSNGLGLAGSHGLYRWAMRLLALPLLAWLWWRGRREPGYREHGRERLGFVQPPPGVLGGLWIHAASVGEAQAALSLWPGLQAQWGESAVVWTTQTPAARRHQLRFRHAERIRRR